MLYPVTGAWVAAVSVVAWLSGIGVDILARKWTAARTPPVYGKLFPVTAIQRTLASLFCDTTA